MLLLLKHPLGCDCKFGPTHKSSQLPQWIQRDVCKCVYLVVKAYVHTYWLCALQAVLCLQTVTENPFKELQGKDLM